MRGRSWHRKPTAVGDPRLDPALVFAQEGASPERLWMTDREIFRLWTALDGSTRYDQARASQRPPNPPPRPEHRDGGHPGPGSMQAGAERAQGAQGPRSHRAGCERSGGSAIDGAAAYDGDGDAMRPVGGRRDEGKSE